MMDIKGYIFDYGGTLDTAGCHWGKKLWHAYEQEAVPVSEAQFRAAYVFAERHLGAHRVVLPDFTFRQVLDAKLGLQLDFLVRQGVLPGDEGALGALRQRLLGALYRDVCRTVAHSRAVLAQLHGRFPLVLVSNFYGNMETVLREMGLRELFAAVVESAVVGVRKPDERIFRLGIEALGLAAREVVVVGDSYEKDILPAHALGCRTAWLRGEGWTAEAPDATSADRVIADLEELLA